MTVVCKNPITLLSRLSLVVFFLLLVGAHGLANTEERSSSYRVRQLLTSPDPLRQSVQAIAQSSDNALWIGTKNGLGRFDGRHFEFVPVGPGAKPEDQCINALSPSEDGSLWIGTSNGLFRLRQGQWIGAQGFDGGKLPILSLQRTHDDSVWIGTAAGIWRRIPGDNFLLVGDPAPSAVSPHRDPLGNPIYSLAENSDGALWLSVQEKLLLLQLHGGKLVTHFDFTLQRPQSIRAICSRRDGSVWIGGNSGLVQFKDGQFTSLDIKDGLPDNRILALHEDRQGNLWIGTAHGLCRLSHSRVIVETKTDKTPFGSIACIFEDWQGQLWIGGDEGLFQLHAEDPPRSSRLNGLSALPPGSPLSYSSRYWRTSDDPSRAAVQSITQTSDGYLWIGNQNGLSRFNSEQFESIRIGAEESHDTNLPVNSLLATEDGSLWVGTAGSGLFQLRNNKWVPHPMPPESDPHILALRSFEDSFWMGTRQGLAIFRNGKVLSRETSKDLAPGPKESPATLTVRAIARGVNGETWIAAGAHLIGLSNGVVLTNLDLARFNPSFIRSVCRTRDGSVWAGAHSGLLRLKDGKVTHYSRRDGLPDNIVTMIYEDRRGVLWVGTSGGLCRQVNDRFVVETTSEGDVYDYIYTLFEDREDNLWVGAKNGLYQLRMERFTSYTTRDGLAHNNVVSVYEDSDNVMWIGTWGGGLNSLHDGRVTVYSSARHKAIRNDMILAIGGSRDGGIWFSQEFDGGFSRLKNGYLTRLSLAEGSGFTPARVMVEDSAGRLLIGAAHNSVGLYENGKFASYAKDSTSIQRVRCLIETQGGHVWIGTENGLACHGNEGEFVLTTGDGLIDNFILSLYEDAEGTLWIGTVKGLHRLQNEKNQYGAITRNTVRITAFPGFFDDRISEILEDDSGNLWMATRRGVLRVARSDLNAFAAGRIAEVSSTLFGKADGMESPVCVGVAKPSATKSRDGRLWFATTRGVAVTDPRLQIEKNKVAPPIVIQDVVADKKSVRKAEVRSSLNSSSRRLVIPPGRGELEFHFIALSYAAPKENRFKYKLEGVDADWIDAGTRRAAYYNNIGPGNYTFRVIGCNNHDIWNSIGASIPLTLKPHYWQAWWFKGFVGFTSLCMVATGARFATRRRMQAKLQRLEREHAVERERTRIAQDMHDDLGARLTAMMVISTLAQNTHGDEQKGHLQKLIQSSRDVVQNLDGLVWAVNPGNDSLENTASYLYDFAGRFLKIASIRLRIETPDEMPNCLLTSETRHHLFLVVQEALNNVVKHAEASEVALSLHLQETTLVILIDDNGKGFSSANMDAFGNGLQNMTERAKEVGGSLRIESEPGRGTRVQIKVPLKKTGRP